MSYQRLIRGPALALAGLVRLYQRLISPMFAPSCRYYPCCSQYSITALRRLGLVKGLALTAWRLLRCNPWSPGGVDHVPERWPAPSSASLSTVAGQSAAGQLTPSPTQAAIPAANPGVRSGQRLVLAMSTGPEPVVQEATRKVYNGLV